PLLRDLAGTDRDADDSCPAAGDARRRGGGGAVAEALRRACGVREARRAHRREQLPERRGDPAGRRAPHELSAEGLLRWTPCTLNLSPRRGESLSEGTMAELDGKF